MTSREHIPIGIALAAAAAPIAGAEPWVVLLAGALILLSDGRRPVLLLLCFCVLAFFGGIWPGVLLLYVVSAMIGAIAPDLDHPGSRISRALPPLRWLYVLVFVNPLTWLVIGWKGIRKLGGHRQISHSIFAVPAVMLLVGALIRALVRIPGADQLCEWLMYRPPLWLAGGSPQLGVTLMIALGVGAGYLSHELADACTASGWRPLVPWSERKVYLLPGMFRIRTR